MEYSRKPIRRVHQLVADSSSLIQQWTPDGRHAPHASLPRAFLQLKCKYSSLFMVNINYYKPRVNKPIAATLFMTKHPQPHGLRLLKMSELKLYLLTNHPIVIKHFN